MHVLKLSNSLVVLTEAIGLQKGPQAQKTGQRPPKGAEGPQQPSTRARLFGATHQNILVNIDNGIVHYFYKP